MSEPPPRTAFPGGVFAHPRVKAFVDAGRGVLTGLRTQPHLRFHFFAAYGVLLALHLVQAAKIPVQPWLPLAVTLLFALVMALELVNSAVEAACNAITLDHDPHIGAAKDMAAGAVLIAAVAAAGLGLWLVAPPALAVFYCEPGLLHLPAFPAVAAAVALYVLHHFLGRGTLGLVLAAACLWATGVVIVHSHSAFVGVGLAVVPPFGLYGSRCREGRTP